MSVLRTGHARSLKRATQRLIPMILVVLWPFAFHFRLVLSIGGRFQRLDNDFNIFYYAYKPYLLANMASGHIPLWMPQEAGGFSFVLNPFTQALYPVNLAILPFARLLGYWGPLEQQRFTVLAVSLLALGLYLILRKVTLGALPAAAATVIVSSSYKVSETLRFPNATHAAAWVCISLLALVHIRVAQGIRHRVGCAVLLFIAVICLATAGYPYYFVYFFLLLPPFLLWLELGSPQAYRNARVRLRVFLIVSTAAILAALIVVAPYLNGMHRLLKQTTDRRGGNWAYSTQYRFGILDYAGSLVDPPISSPEGWFYFGTAGLVVIALACLILWRQHRLDRYKRPVCMVLLWLTWIVFFGLSAANPLFRIVWESVPLVDSLRVWPRINIFLVFPLALVVGFSIEVVAGHLRDGAPLLSLGRAGIVLPAIVAIVVLVLQVLLASVRPLNVYFVQYMGFFHTPTEREHILWTLLIVDLLVMAAVCIRLSVGRPLVNRRVVTASSIAFLVIWLFQVHGAQTTSWMWVLPEGVEEDVNAELLPVGRPEVLPTIARDALASTRLPPSGSPVFDPRAPWSTAVYANWHYRRYVEFLSDARIEQAVKDQLLGVTTSTRFFLTARRDTSEPRQPTDGAIVPLRKSDVVYYDGSRLVVDVATETAGDLVFADNWDHDWNASVDGQPSELGVAFGTFKSVQVPAGRSRVAFTYCPFSAPVYRWLC
jgi:hypothetical protein